MHSNICTDLQTLLDQPYDLSPDDIESFKENGHIHLKDILDPEVLQYFDTILRSCVSDRKKNLSYADTEMSDRSMYDQAFLQISNVWEHNTEVIPFIFSKRIARIASELLEVSGVRMYHDQALYKEPGGGITPWHTDQRYWPLSSEKSITAWIPLQDTPLEMGPLSYASGSHRIMENRMIEISEESEDCIKKMVKLSDLDVYHQAFNLGDIGFHYGYNFHHAGPNTTDTMRGIQTIIYIDKDMRLDVCDRTQSDADTCCPGIKQGEIINSHLNPILWERDS